MNPLPVVVYRLLGNDKTLQGGEMDFVHEFALPRIVLSRTAIRIRYLKASTGKSEVSIQAGLISYSEELATESHRRNTENDSVKLFIVTTIRPYCFDNASRQSAQWSMQSAGSNC